MKNKDVVNHLIRLMKNSNGPGSVPGKITLSHSDASQASTNPIDKQDIQDTLEWLSKVKITVELDGKNISGQSAIEGYKYDDPLDSFEVSFNEGNIGVLKYLVNGY